MRLEILGRQERKLEEKLLEAKLRKEKKEEKDKEKANRRRQRKEVKLKLFKNNEHDTKLILFVIIGRLKGSRSCLIVT